MDLKGTHLEREGFQVLRAAVPYPTAVKPALRAIGLGIRRHGLPGGQDHAACQGGTFLPELRDDPAIWGLVPKHALYEIGSMPLFTAKSWAEPQILLRFPDEAPDVGRVAHTPECLLTARLDISECACRPALVPHADEEPPWAGHEYAEPSHPLMDDCQVCQMPASDPIHARRRYYKAIVGVALTDHGPDDGALHVWPRSHGMEEWARYFAPGHQHEPVPVPLKAGDAIVMHPKLAHAGSLNLGHTWQARVYFRLLAPEVVDVSRFDR